MYVHPCSHPAGLPEMMTSSFDQNVSGLVHRDKVILNR